MKKFTVILLAFALMMISSVRAFAADTAEVSFQKYVSEDGKVVIDVDISEKGNPCMIQFCVGYDSDVLDCVSVISGSALSGNMAPTINKADGKIYFVWDTLSPLTAGGTLMRIEFDPSADGADASVWIEESEEFIIANENFEEIGSIKGKLEFTTPSSAAPEVPSEELPPEENIPDEGYSGGIIIDKTQVSVDVNDEAEITIGDTEKEVIWVSSDESVAKVEDGKVIPVGPGTATITVMTEDGTEEASCVVTVTGEDLGLNSGSENGEENFLDVDSPRGEREEGIPSWATVLIIVLAAGIIVIVFIAAKKMKPKKEN